MIFGGFLRQSLIDYPGQLSCVLFVSGCNFHCPYCHNPELALGHPDPAQCIDEASLHEFLLRRKGFLDAVVITGGEPTLDGELPSLCAGIRDMGYAIKLDTNGSRPGMLRRLVDEELVDYIAMDVKTALDRYAPRFRAARRSDDLKASIRIILQSGLPHEFRTTCVRPLVDEAAIADIAREISGAGLYALQRCRSERALQPSFFEEPGVRPASDKELEVYRQMASSWVRRCIIR